MRNIKQVEIIKAVIHVIDNDMEEPVFNEAELQINDDINEFLIKHITKSSSDEEAKCAVFLEEKSVIKVISQNILNNFDSFLENSKEIARHFFNSIRNNPNIPSGDLIVCLFNCEYGITLGIMKLDYNKTYIHSIDYVNDKMVINIIPQMIGLPDTGKRLQKCAFVNFQNEECELLVLDRHLKKDNDIEDDSYFLKDVLNCCIISDRRDITKSVLETSENWIRQNIKDNADKAERARSVISRVIKSDDVVNVETIAHHAFGNDEALKENFLNALKESGIEGKELLVDREWAEKKLKRKRLKIDKDMELYIDSEAYEDSDRFQIKRNGDGTIDIVIKHVRNYIEKH
jgi:hypothetical protein